MLLRCYLDNAGACFFEGGLALASAVTRRAFLIAVFRRWLLAMRATSLKEEWIHSQVKHMQAKWNPISHMRIVVQHITSSLARAYMRTGHRDPSLPPLALQVAFQKATSRKGATYVKPNCTGSPLLSLWAQAKSTARYKTATSAQQKATIDKITRDFRRMQPAAKAALRTTHAANIISRRRQQGTQFNVVRTVAQVALHKTPWRIGCATWPCTRALVVKTLQPLMSATSGLHILKDRFHVDKETLERLSRPHTYTWPIAVREILVKLFGCEVDSLLINTSKTLAIVRDFLLAKAAKTFMRTACHQKHFGFCEERDRDIAPDVKAMVQHLNAGTRSHTTTVDKKEVEKFTALFLFSTYGPGPKRSYVIQQIGGSKKPLQQVHADGQTPNRTEGPTHTAPKRL